LLKAGKVKGCSPPFERGGRAFTFLGHKNVRSRSGVLDRCSCRSMMMAGMGLGERRRKSAGDQNDRGGQESHHRKSLAHRLNYITKAVFRHE
jgi:hypothetical protein